MTSFNAAARQAYEILRSEYSTIPVCVIGESIGSGASCHLATLENPPSKIVLIVPFDILQNVAYDHMPYLPVKLLLKDKWNNVESLSGYNGPIDIFGAKYDNVIPVKYAKALAESRPQAVYRELDGGHNDWYSSLLVRIRNSKNSN